MRFAPLLLLLAAPLHAELLATFRTSQGNVVVALQYDKAPQTVANFITLSQGTRARIDPTTGALTRTPLYVGEKFFRVVDGLNGNADFKIAQTGSGNGTATGVPGYSFKDEFDPTLTHVPYVLSMANRGVHTNGSQIFFTGSGSIPHLNNAHTIFGLIKEEDEASRTVINTIIGAGDDATTINAVTISRTDAAAVAFNEFNQNLPECLPVPGHLAVARNVKSLYGFKEPLKPGTTLLAFRSPDLATWSPLGQIYHGTGQPGFDNVTLDSATLPKAFYHITKVTYPDALVPASFAGRTLQVERPDNRTVTLAFDTTGSAGIYADSQDANTPAPFAIWSGTLGPHTATLAFEVARSTPEPEVTDYQIKAAFDSEKEFHILGSYKMEEVNGPYWIQIASGGVLLSKPTP